MWRKGKEIERTQGKCPHIPITLDPPASNCILRPQAQESPMASNRKTVQELEAEGDNHNLSHPVQNPAHPDPMKRKRDNHSKPSPFTTKFDILEVYPQEDRSYMDLSDYSEPGRYGHENNEYDKDKDESQYRMGSWLSPRSHWVV